MHLRTLLSVAVLLVSNAGIVTIHNDVPRVDQFGHILNAHDGCVVFFDGLYYMYGTVYENCTQPGSQCDGPCGYSPNTYSLYTSPDLETWTFITANILPDVEKDNREVDYWMPVVARRNDGKFVMQFWSGHCGFVHPCTEIAFADSPLGPFSNITRIPLQGTPSSQMGFFVDDDGTAYVKYNTVGGDQHHNVEKLTADWTSSTGEYAVLFWKPSFAWMEGGGMFKHKTAYGTLYYYMCERTHASCLRPLVGVKPSPPPPPPSSPPSRKDWD